MRPTALVLLACSLVCQGIAQDNKTPSPIIFIYDASGSMWGQMQGRTKMEIATDVLSASVGSLPENQKVGLVAYGHRKKGDCKDVEFLVDAADGAGSKINAALQSIKPLGMTPLAYAATLVIDRLRVSGTKATIILVTDGIESCDGNICNVIRAAREEGIDFRLHIIGFGLKPGETEQLKCAASAGDGQYYDAADAGGLGAVLNEATAETVDKPKGNVTVYAVKNNVAIDAWVRAQDVNGKRAPVSVRTYRDTASFYLPAGRYDFEVKPLEGSDVNAIVVAGVQSFDDKVVHQDISFDAGKVGIITTNNGANWDCMVKVVDQNGKVAASVRSYQAPKEVEVNPGTYKITIQALAMEGMNTYTEIENITVRAGGITPVAYNFETGNAFIDARAEDNSIDSVVTIEDAASGRRVAGGRTYDRGKEFLLNPGTYNVKVAPLGNYKDRKAQTFTIDVKKGERTVKAVAF